MEFHYVGLLKVCPGARVLYTDTDSIIYKTERSLYDILEEQPEFKERFDLSNLAPDHRLFNNDRKAVPGTMKFEITSQISAFCGLAAKSYALKLSDQTEDRRAKGVKRGWQKANLGFDDYVAVLNGGQPKMAKFQTFRSRNFNMTTDTNIKVSLPITDDKRVFIPNSHYTKPLGYFD